VVSLIGMECNEWNITKYMYTNIGWDTYWTRWANTLDAIIGDNSERI